MKKGFTLIELSIAMLLLGIAIIPLVQFMPKASVDSKKTEDAIRVMHCGQTIVEEIREILSNDYDATISTSGDFSSDGFPKIKYTSSAEESNPGGRLNFKSIIINVWLDSNDNNSWDSGEEKMIINSAIAK